MLFSDLVLKKIFKYLYPNQSFYDFLENELSKNMDKLIDEVDDDKVRIMDIDLCEILAGCDLIYDHDNLNAYDYMGRDWEVEMNRVYKYRSYYIILYSVRGYDEEHDFLCNKEIIKEIFRNEIKVIHELNFDYNKLFEYGIGGSKLVKLAHAYYKLADEKAFINRMTKWYREVYGPNGWAIDKKKKPKIIGYQ
tara:strand:- start:3091 stop:3669 length:579 start_codon:yes stop_codon:yes gene_type:complete